MTVVYFKPSEDSAEQEIVLNQQESLLDGILRSGFDVTFGCKGGVCQSCLMHSTSKEVPHEAQKGLKKSQIEQGYFLACCCHPEPGFIASVNNDTITKVVAKVTNKFALNKGVFCLQVETEMNYRAGQFMTLWNSENIARSYSIASVAKIDNYLEFHIKRIEGGQFSDWAWKHLRIGDEIYLQGPLGDCFYTPDDINQDLFLSGIGTGLAPLYGIIRDALNQGHRGNISLVVGARNSDNFYYVDELLTLQQSYPNVNITFICQSEGTRNEHHHYIIGDIYESVRELYSNFKGVKVFLCGAESFVKKLKKQCFLAGANMKDIASDPFIPSGS